MKWSAVIITIAVGEFGCSPSHPAADRPNANVSAKTIIGKNQCAECEGITGSADDVLLVEPDGTNWVLIGDGPGYKAAQDGHNEGKTITATLADQPVSKTGLNGKPYREVKISDIKIVGP